MQAKYGEMSKSLASMHQRKEHLTWELEGRTAPKVEHEGADERAPAWAPALDKLVCIGTLSLFEDMRIDDTYVQKKPHDARRYSSADRSTVDRSTGCQTVFARVNKTCDI